jgi:hypothetical protein
MTPANLILKRARYLQAAQIEETGEQRGGSRHATGSRQSEPISPNTMSNSS